MAIYPEDNQVRARIAELKALIAPLQDELATLTRQLAAKAGGRQSALQRQLQSEERANRIKQKLKDGWGSSGKYRRPSLLREIANEENISERTVAKYAAQLKHEMSQEK